MGAILAALATVTAQWLPNWNRGFGRVQRTENLAAGLERIVADVAAAEFIPAGRQFRQPVFDGTELSMTFLRSALGPNTRAGLELDPHQRDRQRSRSDTGAQPRTLHVR